MSFIMSKNVEHSLEKTPCRGAHREIYKFHTSVISTHFFDQVEIFFFLTHCIVNNNNNNNNNNNKIITIIMIIIIKAKNWRK